MSKDSKERPEIAPEKQPIVHIYILYENGSPLFAGESNQPLDEAWADLQKGMALDDECEYELRSLTDCPTEDLERIKLIMEIKGALFNFQQIAMAVRAGKMGLHMATQMPVPPGRQH